MQLLYKVLAIIYSVLCLVSAALQYNDPDPLVWMVIYIFAAVFSFAFVTRKVTHTVYVLLAITSVVGFFYMYPEKFEGFAIGEGDIKNIEETREAFGLLIMSVVFSVLAFGAKRRVLS